MSLAGIQWTRRRQKMSSNGQRVLGGWLGRESVVEGVLSIRTPAALIIDTALDRHLPN